MEKKCFQINGIPSILWGDPSNKLFIYIHGQGGFKEEALAFADMADHYEWQVLSIDLPEHGERREEKNSFDPWHIVPELSAVMEYAKFNWNKIALYANSIGAWFSMLSFGNEKLDECLFVSPILDMQQIIFNMMNWAEVSEEQLRRERIISTSFGHTLSWDYLLYAKNHPITKWNVPTRILYGGHDELTERSVAEKFTKHFNCHLTVMEDGEHWFHTPEQLKVLNQWVKTLFEPA